jgi:putative transposase
VHAYVLMTNHVHLLISSDEPDGAGRLMKALGQRYVQYVNRTYRRSGTLWEGRFRSCLTQDEIYLLSCMRYIELNPVRAGMVAHPGEYRCSSYRANAQGEAAPQITPHSVHADLATAGCISPEVYRELFRFELEPGMVDEIHKATNGNVVLGDRQFSSQIGTAMGRRVVPGNAGRPRKASAVKSAGLFE